MPPLRKGFELFKGSLRGWEDSMLNRSNLIELSFIVVRFKNRFDKYFSMTNSTFLFFGKQLKNYNTLRSYNLHQSICIKCEFGGVFEGFQKAQDVLLCHQGGLTLFQNGQRKSEKDLGTLHQETVPDAEKGLWRCGRWMGWGFDQC